MRDLLDTLGTGRVLDAACGTGRHAVYLLDLGHGVTGVDVSAAMLREASERHPRQALFAAI
jgi:predicted TPR repeat methyltransferase